MSLFWHNQRVPWFTTSAPNSSCHLAKMDLWSPWRPMREIPLWSHQIVWILYGWFYPHYFRLMVGICWYSIKNIQKWPPSSYVRRIYDFSQLYESMHIQQSIKHGCFSPHLNWRFPKLGLPQIIQAMDDHDLYSIYWNPWWLGDPPQRLKKPLCRSSCFYQS